MITPKQFVHQNYIFFQANPQELENIVKSMEANECALRLRVNQDYEHMKDVDESMRKMNHYKELNY